VKTDNLVHIAHNVVIGEDSLLLPKWALPAARPLAIIVFWPVRQVYPAISIGNHVTVGPMTGVGKPISDGEVVSSGSPAMPHRTWLRVQRVIPSIAGHEEKNR
jgi:UDP-3-O-[3-hydroxymyristoyl] glucosamine N-acyltransferase